MHYPEYSGAPYEMMTWLYGQAKAEEDRYSRPKEGGQRTHAASQSSDSDDEAIKLNSNSKGVGAVHIKSEKKKD